MSFDSFETELKSKKQLTTGITPPKGTGSSALDAFESQMGAQQQSFTERPPQGRDEYIISRKMVKQIALMGIYMIGILWAICFGDCKLALMAVVNITEENKRFYTLVQLKLLFRV